MQGKEKMKIAEVVFPIPLDKSFSYIIPDRFADNIKIGMRVRVPFGKRMALGYVIKASQCQSDAAPERQLKEIVGVLDEMPKISEELIELSKWVSSYYFCPIGKVLNVVLPLKTGKIVKDTQDPQLIGKFLKPISTFSILNSEQTQVFGLIKKTIDENKFQAHLLYGPPKTGKTEVCLQAIAYAIDRGKNALVVVPEVLLSEIFTKRFTDVFGSENVSIFHSGLTQKKRDVEFLKIESGKAKVVVGTRLAVFCPIKNLGLIVVDGEEDNSLKEEQDPKYNARDIAIQRAKIDNCAIILASSAPSFESFHNALEGNYNMLKLHNIFKGSAQPRIEIIEKKQNIKKAKGEYIFSKILSEEIGRVLDSKEKAILFLNRKGFSTCVICSECGTSVSCPRCQIPLVLSKNKEMTCHYCNYREKVPDYCPNCKGIKLKEFGIGTQKVYQEVCELFPQASPVVFDSDSVKKKTDQFQILQDFKKGKTNLLIGTQILSKEEILGVTLLAVISADAMLALPDFRSSERAFQLLTKLTAIVEPSQKTGFAKVIIQTANPLHAIFDALVKMDYEKFYENEIKMRSGLNYPPFSNIVNIVVSSENEGQCIKISESLLKIFIDRKEKDGLKFDILGPSPAPIFKLRQKFRYQILLKGNKHDMDTSLRAISAISASNKTAKISIDVDPVKMM